MWRRSDRWADYEPSRPRPVQGGIKAASRGGTFSKNWWAQRWIAVLESFPIGARLARGRSYARRGQVLSIDIGRGAVKARVQGSRPRPYTVDIQVRPFSAREREQVAAVLSAQVALAARLLAGEMPAEIETALGRAGVSLFPARGEDLETGCSCPDWSNPCKHSAAVLYLLGEEFDRDPFLIFRVRGLDREALLDQLGSASPAAGPDRPPEPEAAQEAGEAPLPADAAAFWRGAGWEVKADGAGQPHRGPGGRRQPARGGGPVHQLGNFPFWRGEAPLPALLEPMYANASRRAMAVLLAVAGAGNDANEE